MPLIEHLERLRSRLNRIVLLRGVTLWLAVVIVSFSLLAWLDWRIRFEAPLSRWSVSLLFWTIAAGGVFALVIRPWRRRPSLLDLALWIEETDPRWSGELAAAVAFSAQGTSPAAPLQQQLIRRVEGRLETEELRRRTSRRHLGRWGGGLLAVLVVSVGGAQAFPEEASLATARLIYPDQQLNWPRRTKLELLDGSFAPLPTDEPIFIETPGPVEILVRDRIGAPPPHVEFEVRHSGGKTTKSRLFPEERSAADGDRAVFVASVNPGREESVRVRAVADDDQRPAWVTLVRKVPPTLSHVSLRITPPEHLGLEPVSLMNLAGPISAVAGSLIRVRGVVDRGVETVAALREGGGEEIPVSLRSPTEFEFELQVGDGRREPSRIALFADRTERGRSNWSGARPMRYIEISSLEDEPPRVQLHSPASDLQITPGAVVGLHASAVDDFRLAQLSIIASSGTKERVFEAKPEQSGPREWQLSEELAVGDWGLEPNAQVTLFARASDQNPATEPQKSAAVILRVVTDEEKQRELEEALQQSADAVSELLALQEQVRRQAEELSQRHNRDGMLSDGDILHLRQIAHAQSALADKLGHPEQGLVPRVQRLVREVEINRLQEVSFAATLATVSEELTELATGGGEMQRSRENLSALGRMGQGLRSLAPLRFEKDSPEDRFARAIAAQKQTVSRLDVVNRLLSAWRSKVDHEAQWDRIRTEFRETMQETIEVGRETLSRSLEDLPPTLRQGLSEADQRHRTLAERVEEFLTQVRTQPSFSREARFSRIAAELERTQVPDKLRSAARELARNRVAQALELDQQVAEAFARAAGAQGRDGSGSLAEVMQLVDEALDWTAHAAGIQQRLADRLDSALRLSDPMERSERLEPLLRQQVELANDAATWAMRLRHARLPQAMRPMTEAARGMQTLQQHVWRRHRSALDSQTGRIQSALEQSRNELDRIRRGLKQAIQSQTFLDITSDAERLAGQQEEIREQTALSVRSAAVQGRLSRSERSSVNRVVESQQALAGEVERLQEEALAYPVARFALNRVHAEMTDALKLMRPFQVTERITALQSSAADRLRELARAAELEPPPAASDQDPAPAGEPGEGSSRQMGELALLIRLQERLIEREEELLSSGESDLEEELKQLAREQEQLTRLIKQFVQADGSP